MSPLDSAFRIVSNDRSFDGFPTGPPSWSTPVRARSMAHTANLRVKGGRYYFRTKVAYNLRMRLGRSEIARSLQTGER
ncbi:DUF6538 domain-containing protein [Fulvimarina pelagi]|uniref:DUF6538 domain-containing protein n=1 Tax=Fulvimarina pelagi TaxID=217511 RepID=UPI0034E2562C